MPFTIKMQASTAVTIEGLASPPDSHDSLRSILPAVADYHDHTQDEITTKSVQHNAVYRLVVACVDFGFRLPNPAI